ncbi:MAG: GNAT family N-acetyltransferase [Pyrinomonadaceae bacterium]|nr:GNAT family N-acetyltransferase [Pyrinomonadaceae bacterium]
MSSTHINAEVEVVASALPPVNKGAAKAVSVDALLPEDCAEALGFLSLRPIHTVFMAGLMLDNGLVSPFNRGEFYGHRNALGELEAVALIGQKTVIEAHSEEAFESLMRLALRHPKLQLIRGEENRMELLLEHLSRTGQAPRLICREFLLEQTSVLKGLEPVEELCNAAPHDLEQIIAINSAMALEETGSNPLKRDLKGMMERTLCRIERGRVWMLARAGKIVFKAEVISAMPQAVFLEGIYVHPEERGRGVGSRCLTQLGSVLLERVTSITLVVNQENRRALALYQRLNYQLRSPYLTVYF